MDMETQTAQLTEFILPWVGILISLIIAVWVKDIATGLGSKRKNTHTQTRKNNQSRFTPRHRQRESRENSSTHRCQSGQTYCQKS